MSTFVFVDTETLGLYDDAILTSIGMCWFKMEQVNTITIPMLIEQSFYARLDIKSQVDIGRKTTKSTMDFVMGQAEMMAEIAVSHRVKIHELPAIIDGWMLVSGIKPREFDFVDRMSFDISKLAHLYEVSLDITPQVFWSGRRRYEIATALVFAGCQDRYNGMPPSDMVKHGLTLHRADHDAVFDAYRLCLALKPKETT